MPYSMLDARRYETRAEAVTEAIEQAGGDLTTGDARLGLLPDKNGPETTFIVPIMPDDPEAPIMVYEGWECWEQHPDGTLPSSWPAVAGIADLAAKHSA